ncbi:MAG: methyltransferase domain-containing protein [Holosporales bacterium]|jgi:malonyl-CoA O-methyltransferase|nr:methyltransferase domain-containing protein [Holosporales bacterium]
MKSNFDKAAETYDENAVVQFDSSMLLASLCKNTIKEKPKTILDVGCGTGFTTLAIQKLYKTAKCTLCDISENMINVAKSKEELKACEYIVCNAENYDFDEYDLIISNLAFQWFDDLKTFLQKMLSKCKYLAFSILTEESFKDYAKLFKINNINIWGYKYIFSENFLKNLEKQSNVLEFYRKSYRIGFKSAFEAAKHFKNIGGYNSDLQDGSKNEIVSILKSYRGFMFLDYNLALVILEGKKSN